MNDGTLYTLAEELGQQLEAAGLVVTTAESCTGGWIAKCLTDVPGSSTWFERGLVTYSNEAKSSLIDVPARLLDADGAVSEAVVRAMAEGALQNSTADLSVAVSGVAGPDGGSDEKPVGTVWLAWARRTDGHADCESRVEYFRGGRESIRRQAVAAALAGLITLISY
ncbi:MAG: nicotinamide-nucleotide amidohydrolase family protein [Gammaproteobacteria bacterium]|nr:nicotinamide-nucleotide amidohydrolase family protein [Gammaproteobacteria bacterium]MDH3767564.1 nicotinamide-nucleotide amidohydrolase family protein [Gammaproteobacteria bacterium]